MAHIPVTDVLLEIDQAIQDTIITDSGLKLYLDGSYKKEWNVSVTATISALPANPNPKHKKILENIKVGDEVVISYQVVADFEFKGDGAQFIQSTEDNEYLKEFINGKGEMVKMYALPTRQGIKKAIWVGVYLNKQRELIDGAQGDEEEVYRWMSQFPFGKTDIYCFNNFFEYGGKHYWRCSPDQIFAKRNKGHLVAVGNRIICKPIEEDAPKQMSDQIQHNFSVKIRHQDRGRVITGGKEKGIKKDEVISFQPNHCEKYQIGGVDYFLINQNFVLGKWN